MIELYKVKKSFGTKPVLQDVTLTIHDGESVVILGRSGSGKSVALRHILGLLEPDEGEVFVDGINLKHLSRRGHLKLLRKIGMLFQNSALWDSMNVYENIALALRRHRVYKDEESIKERVYECLDMVGLGEIDPRGKGGVEWTASLMPSELSGGMKKRVGLARAIAPKPAYMLYDEPTTGLDPIMAGIINRLIHNLNKEMRITSLTITHDMQSAFTIADRIILLHYGQFTDFGSPKDTLISDNEVMRQFIHYTHDGPVQPRSTDHQQRVHAHH